MRVAVIGGGISGLCCAKELAKNTVEVTVFDTGRRSVGGRCSSRNLILQGKQYVLDHSTQILRPTTPDFKLELESMVQRGFAVVANGKFGTLTKVNDGFFEGKLITAKSFAGKEGMESITAYLSEGLNVRRPCWVSSFKRTGGKWALYDRSKQLGSFDAVVIAHNGKCADNLVAKAQPPIPNIHSLLKVKFGPQLGPLSNMRKMQLCSLWASTLVIPTSQVRTFRLTGATVHGSDTLSWVCDTSAKLGLRGEAHSWTLLSTPEYGAKNKVTD